MTYFITATMERPSFDGRHDTYDGFVYSHGRFEDERNNPDAYDTEQEARAEFKSLNISGFGGSGILSVTLEQLTDDGFPKILAIRKFEIEDGVENEFNF